MKIGKNCMIGGLCGIVDNIEITDEVIIYPMTFVTSSVKNKGTYSGGSAFDGAQKLVKKGSKRKEKEMNIEEIRKYLTLQISLFIS